MWSRCPPPPAFKAFVLSPPHAPAPPAAMQVEEEDVARARNQLKASILFSQDGTTGEAPALVLG